MSSTRNAHLRQFIAYIFFGICTTVVNIAAYWLLAHPYGLGTCASTGIGWFLSVAFAYITNKLWVFDSKSWQPSLLLRETLSFYLCRLLIGLLDLAVMLLTVDILHWNDLLWKILSNILVVILNFIASRTLIFKQSQVKKKTM